MTRTPTPGQRILALMEEGGITRAEMSRRLGITPQAVGQWGRPGGGPGLDLMVRACAELDVSVDELLRRPKRRRAG